MIHASSIPYTVSEEQLASIRTYEGASPFRPKGAMIKDGGFEEPCCYLEWNGHELCACGQPSKHYAVSARGGYCRSLCEEHARVIWEQIEWTAVDRKALKAAARDV